MTVEEVYTNAFDARLVAWTEIGDTPYLNDSDTNYIYTGTSLRTEGDWTFPNSAGSGTINSVKLRLESLINPAGVGFVEVYVWDGSAWVLAGNVGLGEDYAWFELDVSAILNTWAKINGAEVYVRYILVEPPGYGYVRRLTRKVDYTPLAVVAKREIMDGFVLITG